MAGYKTLNFYGVDVKFPYEPYPAQEEYIKKCVEALVNRNHAVLESPTGTGKTLCLLASVIAFREWAKRNPRKNKYGGSHGHQGAPKIIYASRTHSQLTQVVSELRKLRDVCGYQVDMTVVGGRSSLCVDLDVKKITNSSEQQNACRALRNSKDGCGPKKEADKLSNIANTRPDAIPAPKPQNSKFAQFAATKNAPDMLKAAQDEAERKRKHELINSSGVHDIMDIEELVSWCENPPTQILKASYGDSYKPDCGKTICGYYLSRAKADTVEILLMPYNYILDTKIRRRNSFEFKNKILILDEAHNVEQVCEESSSHYLSLKKLEIIGKELEFSKMSVTKPTTNSMDPNPEFFKLHEIDRYIQNFQDFHFHFQQRVFDEVAGKGKDGIAYKVSEFIDQLIATNMFETNASRWAALASLVVGHFVKERSRSSGLSGGYLEEFAFMMEDMHRLKKNKNEYENYRIQICEDEVDSADMEIKIWCFNASYSIDSITEGAEGVYNLILTSGTLSPLDEYINSLGLDRPNQLKTIQLMNDHVIDSKQLFVTTLTGTKGAEFHNVFRNRQDKNMFEKYAEVLRDMKEVSPGGMLVFHPTYALMGISKKFWGLDKKKATFQNRFNVPVFLEPSNKHDLEKMTENFERELVRDEEKGAIFNGVCRGKMSEGVDFADCRGRVVIITGIPYPPAKDPKVMLKKEYLDNRKKTGKGIIDGNKWYGIEAIRAINQAVGRIIRHKNDFGAIIYMDKRFVNQGYSREAYDLMPSWVKRNHQVLTSKDVIGRLRGFFNRMKALQKRGSITVPRPLSEVRAAQRNSRKVNRKETTQQKNRASQQSDESESSKENITMAPVFAYNRPNASVNKGFKDPTKKRPLEHDSSTLFQRDRSLSDQHHVNPSATPEPKRRSLETEPRSTGPAGLWNRVVKSKKFVVPYSESATTGASSPYFKNKNSQSSPTTSGTSLLANKSAESDEFSIEWMESSDEEETKKAVPSTSKMPDANKTTPKESKDEFEFEYGETISILDLSVDENIEQQAYVEKF